MEIIKNFIDVKTVVEVLLIAVIVFIILQFLKGTRGAGVLKGVLFILIAAVVGISFLSQYFRLPRIDYLLSQFLAVSVIALLILFQPELRRAMVRIGQQPILRAFFRKGEMRLINQVVEAVEFLARNRIGALIVLVREVGLASYAEKGVSLDADVSGELLSTIFWPGSPLHDGAVIIEHERVRAAGCLLPLSENPHLPTSFGARHRAALGITEETDSVVVMVSEETGKISLAVRGQLSSDLDPKTLRKMLQELIGAQVPSAPREESLLDGETSA